MASFKSGKRQIILNGHQIVLQTTCIRLATQNFPTCFRQNIYPKSCFFVFLTLKTDYSIIMSPMSDIFVLLTPYVVLGNICRFTHNINSNLIRVNSINLN